MNNNVNILEIMEKTIDTLKNNKNLVITIIQDLQHDHDEKKKELDNIKSKLPGMLLETSRLKDMDKKLRQKLMTASNDFSPTGHANLKVIFEEANTIHTKLFKAEEAEQHFISRRNHLELELKKLRNNIELAENMVRQLLASLSYLQAGINDLNETKTQPDIAAATEAHAPVLTAFRCIENEKSRIARDLHDGPIQRIASVQMRIDFCKTAVSLDLEKGLHLLENLKQDLACTLSEVRDILFDLNPAPLEKLGLKICLDQLLYNILDKMNIEVRFNYQLEHLKLTQLLQSSIYRIIQELINNVRKHSKATAIQLELTTSNDHIYIKLQDNGIGFSVPEDLEIICAQSKSYGLSNIYTRVKNLNGLMKIDSQPDLGSCFKIQLPILLS